MALDRERLLAADIRRLLIGLRDAVIDGEGPGEDAGRLAQAAEDLEDLFLLVVVGEFNAGKSALINALIGRRLLEEGVTPTTATIQVLTFEGEHTANPSPSGQVSDSSPTAAFRTAEGVITRRLSVPELADIKIVDTPGTNAILRHHEVLTRNYMPRADLVLFVTSADRPFTETERAFLGAITEWGKKIVFIVNKADLLDAGEEREVEAFVGQAIHETLGFKPEVFAVSAKVALRHGESGELGLKLVDDTGPAGNSEPTIQGNSGVSPQNEGRDERVIAGWKQLVDWLRRNLESSERLRLKLGSPLGLARRIMVQVSGRVSSRQTLLASDAEGLSKANAALQRFEVETRGQFKFRLDAIENHLLRLSQRAAIFLDTYYRLGRLRTLLNGDQLRQDFEAEVVGTAPQAIAAEVDALVDWLVDREHAERIEVRRSLVELGAASGSTVVDVGPGEGFAKRRQDLIDTVARRAEAVTASFDPAAESERLVANIHDTLAHAGLAEAGALGLGLLLKAIIAPAIFEATGVVAAGLLVALGFSVIPRRRAQAAAALQARVSDLSKELITQLTHSLEQELADNRGRWESTLVPYAEFISREQAAVERLASALETAGAERERLQAELAADGSFPINGGSS